MSSINPETVVSVLKDQIENYDQKTEVKEEGRIIQIADGIATVYGMDQAMYGELVIFETGVHGLVLNVERNCIGCVLLGSDHGLMEGSKVCLLYTSSFVLISSHFFNGLFFNNRRQMFIK